MKLTILRLLFIALLSLPTVVQAQHSVARQWNEALLQSIREDFARPTVHARNLFYTSVAMYDAWAVYDTIAQTYFLGKTINGYTCPFSGIDLPTDIEAARKEAMSFAAYRILTHRFADSPGANAAKIRYDLLMSQLGYDIENESLNYLSGSPAALGNYLALFLINYGLQDNSNEQNDYANKVYSPVNAPLIPQLAGNDTLLDPNRWQSLALDTFIDQSGHVLPGVIPDFLSPEWGSVYPFALDDSVKSFKTRDGDTYTLYHDPGTPPLLDTNATGGMSEEYKWGFGMVSVWSSHLDAKDTTTWDISPAGIGNIQNYPTAFSDHNSFYKFMDGGDVGTGWTINPKTGQPYAPQRVKRGDYARVLAEFWADGPDSETPPGHWFTILNYVNDHPSLVKKFEGEGQVLSDLEWDVKSYFCLAGAMHDAAITAWGVKGWYDYIRPISAIRYMAGKGQSSDTNLPSYHPAGVQLVSGMVELVKAGDSLAGPLNEHANKIKVYAWKGPEYIDDPATDEAGVGWILAENWWPYQRPTFITPPFAGYVSGHSTYSRAAAEVLTAFTGDAYFPGGIGEFEAKKNDFLVFEEGPSETITLQWATYRDASDQCSLSRIWGGIHPPADDVPGRLMGIEVGNNAFDLAKSYFVRSTVGEEDITTDRAGTMKIFPNPSNDGIFYVDLGRREEQVVVRCFSTLGAMVKEQSVSVQDINQRFAVDLSNFSAGVFYINVEGKNWNETRKIVLN